MSGIVVIGEAIADFLPRDEGPTAYACVLGGSGVNTALALARLGQPVRYLWSLSRDALGQRFRRALLAEGVDLGLAQESGRPSALAVVSPAGASHGDMFALHCAGTAHEDPPDLARVAAEPDGHLHAASFASMAGAAAAPCLDLMRRWRLTGTTSFDPNIRAACLPPRAESVALTEARVAAATIARASLEDLAWLYPQLAPHEALQRWLALGCDLAIATRGPAGALALNAEGFVEVPAPAVAVVDTVGAGDAFTAGFFDALARRGRLGRQGQLVSGDDLAACLAFAARVAALTCARVGCDPPRAADLAQ